MTAHLPWSGRRVVMVSHDYAPDQIGIAPYATETAEYIASLGARVDVLTMPPHYPNWQVPADFPRGYSHELRGGVDVWRIPTFVPRDPTLFKRLAFEGSWLLGALPMAVRDVVRQADVVIGVSPGIFGAMFAARIARGRPLIQIVQDLVTQAATQSGMSGAAHARRALAQIEARALRRATAVTVPARGFFEPLQELGVHPDRISLVPNWSRVPVPTTPDPAELRDRDDEFTIMHAGNMGLKQGLDALAPVIAEAELGEPWLRFRFLGGGSQGSALRTALEGRSNADILPSVPEDQLADTLRGAQALLVHERASVKDMCLPSKLTTYFAMGRPVIAVTCDEGATAREVRRSGGGIVVQPGDTAGFLAAARKLRENPEYAVELGQAGQEHSRSRLSRERSLGTIESLLDDAFLRAGKPRRSAQTRSIATA